MMKEATLILTLFCLGSLAQTILDQNLAHNNTYWTGSATVDTITDIPSWEECGT